MDVTGETRSVAEVGWPAFAMWRANLTRMVLQMLRA
jgi:hypothetical protein